MRATLSSQHMKIVRVVEVRVTVTKPLPTACLLVGRAGRRFG